MRPLGGIVILRSAQPNEPDVLARVPFDSSIFIRHGPFAALNFFASPSFAHLFRQRHTVCAVQVIYMRRIINSVYPSSHSTTIGLYSWHGILLNAKLLAICLHILILARIHVPGSRLLSVQVYTSTRNKYNRRHNKKALVEYMKCSLFVI